MTDRILKALIIHHFVDDDYLSKEELAGVNNILESFTTKTLKMICEDLRIDIEED